MDIPTNHRNPSRTTSTLSVSALKAAWTDAHVQLEAGDTVNITASGKISVTGHHVAETIGPEGSIGQIAESYSNFPVRGIAKHALVAKIRFDTPEPGKDPEHVFAVGATASYTTPRTGRLYFIVNDNSTLYNDNKGQFDVTIEVVRPSDQLGASEEPCKDCIAAQDALRSLGGDFRIDVISRPLPHDKDELTNSEEGRTAVITGICFAARKGEIIEVTETGALTGGGTLFVVPAGCQVTWHDGSFDPSFLNSGPFHLTSEGHPTFTAPPSSNPPASGKAAQAELMARMLENWHHERWPLRSSGNLGFRAERKYAFTLAQDGAIVLFPLSTDTGHVNFKARCHPASTGV